MNYLSVVLLITFLAACSAGPLEQDFSTTDDQGGYHFGFNDGHQARQEKRTPEGVVRGSYRYIDANGETQTITYTADSHNGFLASGSNFPKVPEIIEQPLAPIPEVIFPVAVEETPEVKAARAEHLEAHKKAVVGEVQSAPAISLNQYPSPIAVQYHPQVYAFNSPQLVPQGGYLTYASQPAVQYIIQGSQYHPDYQPYAAL